MTAVLIMVDGLRPDAIEAARTPQICALLARGVSTFFARSVMPSITLPCHTSIFHSVPPQRHGIMTLWTSLLTAPAPAPQSSLK